MPDKVDRLYKVMVDHGVQMPDVNKFRSDLAHDAKRQRLYDFLTEKGVSDLPSFDQFSQELGFKKKVTTDLPDGSAGLDPVSSPSAGYWSKKKREDQTAQAQAPDPTVPQGLGGVLSKPAPTDPISQQLVANEQASGKPLPPDPTVPQGLSSVLNKVAPIATAPAPMEAPADVPDNVVAQKQRAVNFLTQDYLQNQQQADRAITASSLHPFGAAPQPQGVVEGNTILQDLTADDGSPDNLKRYRGDRLTAIDQQYQKSLADLEAQFPEAADPAASAFGNIRPGGEGLRPQAYYEAKKNLEDQYKATRKGLVDATDVLAYTKAVNEQRKNASAHDQASGNYINTKEIGRRVREVQGDPKAEVESRLEKEGFPLSARQKAENDLVGLAAARDATERQVAAIQQAGGSVPDWLKNQQTQVTKAQASFLDTHQDYRKQQVVDALSTQIARNKTAFGVLAGQWVTADEIRQAAKELGLPEKYYNDVAPDDIKKEGAVGAFVNGFNAIGAEWGAPLMRSAYKLAGADPAAADQHVDESVERYTHLGGEAPTGQAFFRPGMKVNTDASSSQFLQNVADPKGGEFTWQGATIANGIAGAMGTLLKYSAGGEAVGAVLADAGVIKAGKVGLTAGADAGSLTTKATADAMQDYDGIRAGIQERELAADFTQRKGEAGNMANMFISQYDNSYRQGKAEGMDFDKAQQYAFVRSLTNSFIFTKLMPTQKITGDLLNPQSEVGKDLFQLFLTKGEEAVTKDAVQPVLKKAIVEGLKDTGKMLAASEADKAADYLTTAIYSPQGVGQHDFFKESAQEAIQMGMATIIPSIIGSHNRLQTASDVTKGMMYDMGSRPQDFISQIGQANINNEMPLDVARAHMQVVKDMQTARDMTPDYTAEGNGLSEKQKVDYNALLVRENVLRRKLEKVSGDEVQKKAVEGQIKELQNSKERILRWANGEKGFEVVGANANNDNVAVGADAVEQTPTPATKGNTGQPPTHTTQSYTVGDKVGKYAVTRVHSNGTYDLKTDTDTGTHEITKAPLKLLHQLAQDSKNTDGTNVGQPAAPQQEDSTNTGVNGGSDNTALTGVEKNNAQKKGEAVQPSPNPENVPATGASGANIDQIVQDIVKDPKVSPTFKWLAQSTDAKGLVHSIAQQALGVDENDKPLKGGSKRSMLEKALGSDAGSIIDRSVAVYNNHKKGGNNAVQEQSANEGLLRPEQSQVGLQEVGSGNPVAPQEGEPQKEEVKNAAQPTENAVQSGIIPKDEHNTVRMQRSPGDRAKYGHEDVREFYVPEAIAKEAYQKYAEKEGAGVQSYERIMQRGGFGMSELDEFVPDWKDRIQNQGKENAVQPTENAVQQQPAAHNASYEDRRKAGAFKDQEGNLHERQQNTRMVLGNRQNTEFAEGVLQPVQYGVMEAGDLQPSHTVNGHRNPKHFLPEAQPKERTDEGSARGQQVIADNPDVERLSASPNAYSGAPIVNPRGELLQGNNRARGIKMHYEQGGTAYRNAVEAEAEKVGIPKEQLHGFKNPVLVRVAHVDDKKAIELGNYDVKQTETGGQQRIDPVTTSRRIPFTDKLAIVRKTLTDPDVTINQNIRNNIKDVYTVLSGYLTDAQRNTLFNKQGEITPNGLQDIEALMRHFIFDGGDVHLPGVFEDLPAHIREGMFKALPQIYGVPQGDSLIPELQNAAILLNATFNSRSDNVRAFLAQKDMFNSGKAARYSPADIALAEALHKAGTQKEVSKIFRTYQHHVLGSQDMFNTTPPMTKGEALKAQFGVDYDYNLNDLRNELNTEAENPYEPSAPAANDGENTDTAQNDTRSASVPGSDATTNPADAQAEGGSAPAANEQRGAATEREALAASQTLAPWRIGTPAEVSFNTPEGEVLAGQRVAIPGYEDMDTAVVKDGFTYRIYEVATGNELATSNGFTQEDAIDEVRQQLEAKPKFTATTLYGALAKNNKIKAINESPAFTEFKEQHQREQDKQPYQYSEDERREFQKLIHEFEPKGVPVDHVRSLMDSRKGTRYSMRPEVASVRAALERSLEQKQLNEMQARGERLPPEHIIRADNSFSKFRETYDDKRGLRFKKLDELAPSLVPYMYNAWAKAVAVRNDYGYYPDSLPDTKAWLELLGALGAKDAGRKGTVEGLINEVKTELIPALEAWHKQELPDSEGYLKTPREEQWAKADEEMVSYEGDRLTTAQKEAFKAEKLGKKPVKDIIARLEEIYDKQAVHNSGLFAASGSITQRDLKDVFGIYDKDKALEVANHLNERYLGSTVFKGTTDENKWNGTRVRVSRNYWEVEKGQSANPYTGTVTRVFDNGNQVEVARANGKKEVFDAHQVRVLNLASLQDKNAVQGDKNAVQPENALDKLKAEYEGKSVDELVALKKQLYANADIETPKSPEEKLLESVIAKKYSDINAAIRDKNRPKTDEPAPEPPPVDPVDEDLKKQIRDAMNDFRKALRDSMNDLGSLNVNFEVIGKGLKVLQLYAKRGIHKFSEAIRDLKEHFGPLSDEELTAMSGVYAYHRQTATPELRSQMEDENAVHQFVQAEKEGAATEKISSQAPPPPAVTGSSTPDVPVGASSSGAPLFENSDGTRTVETAPGKFTTEQKPLVPPPVIVHTPPFMTAEEKEAREPGPAQEAESALLSTDPERHFMNSVKEAIRAGEKWNIVRLRKEAETAGMPKVIDTHLQELVEGAVVELSRDVQESGLSDRSKFDLIQKIHDTQPSINMRSSDRIMMQQYSTPAPMAFVAGMFAGANDPDSVFEPSAGNGLLTIYFTPGIVHVNEIDPVRLSVLSRSGYAQITRQDATLPFAIAKRDAVISNPPFGGAPEKVYDNYRIRGLDEQMLINALENMKDDGRASFIIGGHNAYDEKGRLKADRVFFNYLYSHYNVRDVIDMAGSLYGKQGTTFPTRMILIEGRKPQPFGAAPLRKEGNNVVTSFDELYNRVEKLNSDLHASVLQSQVDAIGTVNNPVYDADAENAPDKAGAGEVVATESGEPDTAVTTDGRKPGANDLAVPPDRSTGGDTQRPGSGSVSNRPGTNSDKPLQDKPTPGESRPDTAGGRPADLRGNEPNAVSPNTERAGVAPKNTTFSEATLGSKTLPYNPRNSGTSLKTVVPAQMAAETERTLDKVKAAVGSIDDFVRDELGYEHHDALYKALSAEQIDAVALAIHQIKNGQGMIIGDQTGVGKGRIAAAMLRWAVNQGKTPVFISEKANLFSDLYRDMKAIGSGHLVPFIVNDKDSNADPSITEPGEDDTTRTVYEVQKPKAKEAAFKSGTAPAGTSVVLATYSQFSSSKETVKKSWLRQVAQDNILVLDEAHNAGGEGNTYQYMHDVLTSSKGTVYLSATWAKKPNNIPIYAMKTAMSEANMTKEELVEAIKGGGVAMQEIVSSQLVESGQMLRRERDMGPVEIDYDVLDKTNKYGRDREKEHREKMDKVTGLVREVIDFQNKYIKPLINKMDEELAGEGESAGMTNKDMGVTNTSFASKVFQVIHQLLFSIKADDIADAAVDHLKADRKVVIGCNSTMESFIDFMGYEPGDYIPSADFSSTILRGLEGTLRYSVKKGWGNSETHTLSLSELSPTAQAVYSNLRQKIAASVSEIPLSPIDTIIQRIEAAGYSCKEITGRSKMLRRQADTQFMVEKRIEKNKNKLVNAFQNGSLDCLIINASGSTGLSLHADKNARDQRQRVLIGGQLELNINTEVQKRGRVDRTNQVLRAMYQYMVSAIPAEKRLLMMFQAKNKSLSANASATQKTMDEMYDDFLNEYGDKVVFDYLLANPIMNQMLNDPIKVLGKSEEDIGDMKPKEGLASTVTGYVAIMPTAMQEKFYSEVLDQYRGYLDQLNSMGENTLEVLTMPLAAKTLQSQVVVNGKGGTSPFGSDTMLEKIEANVLKRPLTQEQVQKEVTRSLGGKTPAEVADSLTAESHDYIMARIKQGTVDLYTLRQEMLAEAPTLVREREAKKKKLVSEQEIQELIKARLEEINSLIDDRIDRMEYKETNNRNMLARWFQNVRVGSPFGVPASTKNSNNAGYIPGIFLGWEVKDVGENKFRPSNVVLRFATTMGSKRVIKANLSNVDFMAALRQNTGVLMSSTERDQIKNDWDSLTNKSDRQPRYVVTGNLLQGYSYAAGRGQLVSYTTDDGGNKKGILLPEEWKPDAAATMKVPIANAEAKIRSRGSAIAGDVSLFRNPNTGEWAFDLPNNKKAKPFYSDKDVQALTNEKVFVGRGNKLTATVSDKNLTPLLRLLQDRFKLAVDLPAGNLQSPVVTPQMADDHTNLSYGSNNEEAAKLSRANQDAKADAGAFEARGETGEPPASFDDALRKVLPRTFAEDFTEKAVESHVGYKVNSDADIAELFSLYRSPHIEKAHVVFVKDGAIVGNQSITSNNPTAVDIWSPEEIALAAYHFKADGVFVVHNHPSGNPAPSAFDHIITRQWKNTLTENGVNFMGHVILNGNRYSLLDGTGAVQTQTYLKPKPELFSPRYQINTADKQLATAQMVHVADYVLKTNQGQTAIVYVDPEGCISGYNLVAQNAVPADIVKAIEAGKVPNGSTNYYLASQAPNAALNAAQLPSGLIGEVSLNGGARPARHFSVAPENKNEDQTLENRNPIGTATATGAGNAVPGDTNNPGPATPPPVMPYKPSRIKSISGMQAYAYRNPRFTGDVTEDRKIVNGIRRSVILQAQRVVKNLPKKFRDQQLQENVYNHVENPTLPLSRDEKEFLDDYVQPLKEAVQSIFFKIRGINPEMAEGLEDLMAGNIGYVPRFVVDKRNAMTKAVEGTKNLFGGSLNRKSNHLMSRVMKVITDEQGNKEYVALRDGKIFRYSTDGEGMKTKEFMGFYDKVSDGGLFTDKEDRQFSISDATVKDIEAETDVEYYKTPLANYLNALVELKQVDMAQGFMDTLKQTLKDSGQIIRLRMGDKPPKGYAVTTLPQFQGYAFPKRVAAELNRMHFKEDPFKHLTAINNFLRNAVVFGTGIAHWHNELNFWAKQGGISRLARPDRMIRAGHMAAIAMRDKTPEYYEIMEKGGSLMLGDTRNYSKLLLEATVAAFQSDKSAAKKVAEYFGYGNPVKLMQRLGEFSHASAMGSHDFLMLQAVFEKKLQGWSTDDAIREVNRFLPQFDIPSTLLGQEWVSKLVRNPNVFMFSGYHYDGWKSYGNIFKDLGSGARHGDLKKILRSVDRLAMCALLNVVAYPIMEAIASWFYHPEKGEASKDKKIHIRRAGTTKLEYDVKGLVTGETTLAQFLYGQLTFSPGSEFAFDMFTDMNLNPYSSVKPYIPTDLVHHPLAAATDIGRFAGEKFSPLDEFNKKYEPTDKSTWVEQYIRNQLDVKAASLPERRRFFALLYEREPVAQKVTELQKEGKFLEAWHTKYGHRMDLHQAEQAWKAAEAKYYYDHLPKKDRMEWLKSTVGPFK